MKKKLIIVLATCMATLAMSLVGCGGYEYADDAHVGTWSASTIEMDGIELAASDFFEQYDLTFEASGNATIEYAYAEEYTNFDYTFASGGKWEPSDNGVLLKEYDYGQSDDILELELLDSDAGLVLEYEGMTMIFVKK